ncbi:queuosine precursor transporter [Sporomusa silvacetica DSM 10669]|uniref:Probable queuosine precursor transporter n=1 Tax=Sporomusa silvacetica DSM 10669 TaxID=1123289 RepID=A0ABZ3ING5_9FIRM|nr:queuosine precursor transporter [Sporomusa silvacetica]OZC18145.1 inner membrane protein YhhQ [Sporomusa silvacetica DSM 10669]
MQYDTQLSSNKYSGWFIAITAGFITCLLTANIISIKMVDIFGLVMPVGTIIFPVSYIFGDVLTEVYGFRKARRVIWLGFACNILMVVAIWTAIHLPAAGFWGGQSAYEQILGFTPRLLLASFVAYLIGEFTNSYILAKMKIATKGKLLWTRTIGSTVIGEGLDSLVFIAIAFWGSVPLPILFSAMTTQWLVKSAYEILVTPVTYMVINFLKRVEGIDTYDTNTQFNPFHITE